MIHFLTRSFKTVIIYKFIFIIFIPLQTFSREFKRCDIKEPGRTELDNVCPRLEGIHPQGCCPQVFDKNKLTCNYHIVKERGQPILANSQYTVCENGDNKTVQCCAPRFKACYIEPITRPYRPRLIHRSNTCCFENCPPADYWRNPPNPDLEFKEDHELSNAGAISLCVPETINECTNGSSASCEPSQRCPPPPSPPSTGSGSSSGSGSGGGGTGGTPAPSPPSTPAPTPSPPPSPPPPPPAVGGET